MFYIHIQLYISANSCCTFSVKEHCSRLLLLHRLLPLLPDGERKPRSSLSRKCRDSVWHLECRLCWWALWCSAILCECCDGSETAHSKHGLIFFLKLCTSVLWSIFIYLKRIFKFYFSVTLTLIIYWRWLRNIVDVTKNKCLYTVVLDCLVLLL
jgi:hypothetical protein